jgi:hypothetical protein
MKLIYYLPEGNYLKEKDLKLSDIMRCGLPSNSNIGLTMGSNIDVSCDYNFNNLLGQIAGKNYQAYIYQILLLGENN